MHEKIKLILHIEGFKKGFLPVTEHSFELYGKKKLDVVWLDKTSGKICHAFEIEMPSSKGYIKFNESKLKLLEKNGTKVLQIMIYPNRIEVLYTNMDNKELRYISNLINPRFRPNSKYAETLISWNVNGKIIKIPRWVKSLLSFYFMGEGGVTLWEEVREFISLPETINYLISKGFVELKGIGGKIGMLISLMSGGKLIKFGNQIYSPVLKISDFGKATIEEMFEKRLIDKFYGKMLREVAVSIR